MKKRRAKAGRKPKRRRVAATGLAEGSSWPHAHANKPADPKGGRKVAAVRRVLRKLYADGVSDLIATTTIREQVIAALGHDVSWDTVNCALGRDRR